jgi:hypothetical protein
MSRQSSDTPHYAVYSPTSTLKHGESNRYLLENLCSYDYDGFDRTIGAHTVWRRKKPGDPGKKIVTV